MPASTELVAAILPAVHSPCRDHSSILILPSPAIELPIADMLNAELPPRCNGGSRGAFMTTLGLQLGEVTDRSIPPCQRTCVPTWWCWTSSRLGARFPDSAFPQLLGLSEPLQGAKTLWEVRMRHDTHKCITAGTWLTNSVHFQCRQQADGPDIRPQVYKQAACAAGLEV